MSESALIRLAVEHWKLLRSFERAADRLPVEYLAKTTAQARYSAGQLKAILDDVGIKLVTFDGLEFEPNLAATAVNIGEIEGGGRIVVASTIEPAVMKDMAVISLGKVVVASADGGTDAPGN